MGGAETFGVQSDYFYVLIWPAKLGSASPLRRWGGPESVRRAVFDLNAERLGHGVQVTEDPILSMNSLRDITLEVCPGSNVALQNLLTSIASDCKVARPRREGHCINRRPPFSTPT